MNNVLLQDFTLKSMKYDRAKGAVEWSGIVRFKADRDTVHAPISGKWPRDPHGDLVNILEKLKPYFSELCGHADAKKFMTNKELKANKAQLEIFDDYYKEKLNEYVVVTGVSINGEDAKRNVIITGKYNGLAINPKAHFSGTQYGWESDVEVLCDAMENEIYEMVWQGKAAELADLEANVDLDQVAA